MVSRFGNDSPQFRDASSKMLSTFILTMRGTPFVYNGDELGMSNAGFKKIEDFRDVQTRNEYQHQKNTKGDLNKFMTYIQAASRDNSRTPFQWDSTSNAGFSSGKPWIQVATNYKLINARQQEMDPNSCLNYFRKLVALRNANIPVLVYGKYTLLDKQNPDIYAYTREADGRKILILLNFSSKVASASVPLDVSQATLLLSNYADGPTASKNSISLKPYQSAVYRL